MMTLDQIKKLPKIELHRHLEGSIPIPLVIEWHKKYGLPLPPHAQKELQVKKPMPLNDVLERLFYQQKCFQDIESVETLTYEVLKSIAEDNIKLIELRFSPGFMAEPRGLDFDDVMKATLRAKTRAEKDFDIAVGYLLISSRDMGEKICEETIDLAIQWKKYIVGIDLAGPEESFPPKLFQKPFERAHKAGLHITVHTGEVTDPIFIQEAIDYLHAERIGHGVQAIRNPAIRSLLKERNIPLELCPTSNVLTQAVPHIKEHPLKMFIEENVPVTLNSDDPTLFATTLSQEYRICVEELGLTSKDLIKLTQTAFDHSFIPPLDKKRIWDKHFRSISSFTF